MAGIELQNTSTGGLTQAAGDARYPLLTARQLSRLAAQFDKTDTTLTNVTGLTATVAAAGVYAFMAYFAVTPSAIGQSKMAIGGTATATSIAYLVTTFDSAGTVSGSRTTAMSPTSTQVGVDGTSYLVQVSGTIVVNAGGTLTLQFAQFSASGTSSVLAGGIFDVSQIS